jgi:hypothetical protein
VIVTPVRRRIAFMATVTLVGALVATWVARASSGVGNGFCRDLAEECLALTRTYSLRVGVVAGAVTVLMLLTVAGLLRMAAQDEARRAEAAAAGWE